ncbi:xanthine dehydrogenase family protein molybdopterin-binding subunit [Azospirillum picis]|uniref:Carbon-monoxide dehydrogenase large subunit n=1 Tax=Azospirillum picis TaxID=488438 RepID=A0ABU0MLN9_9PROT|nr:xanthine dehydrogenase family protein molybdopterin-binding subunit [Azospirillum picis]MBP2300998.1 carbon-monoxide dehydrogenase large subunit [Azospirillum picis]MDQ0534382.1 carbon-monoxide dehydrogenase large subunit [Azospirillum picis]
MANPNGIGASVRRREDQRFLTGRGNYTDDFKRLNMTHAVHVRSPYAHARILGIDASGALAMPGVVAVLTGADMEADKVGSLPCGWQIHSKDGSPMKEPPHYPLARDRVRYVGDAVAVVIAETREQARDAAEAVVVDYEELPAAATSTRAIDGSAPLVHDDAPGNVCYDWHLGDKAAVDAAFAQATHVATIDLVNQRLVPNAMEPRAALGEYDPSNGEYTLTTTSQNPHVTRLLMGAFVLGIPEHKLRVVAPDVGGGFGSKIFHYGEEAVVTWAARKVGRPVKWTADRSESFLTDAHGRDHVSHAEMAMDADGNFLALRVSTLANLGAYLSTFAPSIPTYLYATLLAGQYKTPAIYAEVKAVFTHTAPVDAYRGAGRPEACYLIERLVDVAAGVVGLDKTEIRRRNFVPAEAMPYQTPVALQYDTGDFAKNLDIALPLVDYDGFRQRRADSRARGKLRGIGFATYIEACGIAPSNVAGALGARAGLYECAEVRFHPTGSVTVFTGAHSHGQGHETTFAQIVAERFGIPIENVEIVHGDTNKIPFGMGTYGSRSLAVGGSALVKAMDKVERKAKKIAAHMLEAAETDIEVKDGRFTVAGTDKSLGIGDIALQAYVPHNFPLDELEPGLDEQAFYDPKNFTYPNGCHVCEVEIDPDTGVTTIVNFAAVDDFGRVINPLIVEGQVHGGLVQGIGQALFENCVYDEESGQLVTGSYMDYCMPRADDVPSFTVRYHEDQPCTHNPLGVKGCGEAGTIGAAAAVINAVVDALSDYGVTHMDMPATPEKVWRVIREATPAMAAE